MQRFLVLLCVGTFLILSGCATIGGIFFSPNNPAAAWANLQSVMEREIKLTGAAQPGHIIVTNEQAVEDAARGLSNVVAQGSIHRVDVDLSILNQATGMRETVKAYIRIGGAGIHHADQVKRNGTKVDFKQKTSESIVLVMGGKGYNHTGNELQRDRNGGVGGDASTDLTMGDANFGHGNLVLVYGGKGGNGSRASDMNPFNPQAPATWGTSGGDGGDASAKISGNNRYSLKGADAGNGGQGGSGFRRGGQGGRGGIGGSASIKGGDRNVGDAVAGAGGKGGKGGKAVGAHGTGGTGGSGGTGGALGATLGSGSTLNGHGHNAPSSSWSGGAGGAGGDPGHGDHAGQPGSSSLLPTGGSNVQIAP